MAVTTLSPIYKPQYVANSSTALTFAPLGGTTVPAGTTVYLIQTARVSNNSGSPVTLEVWRVPNGASADNQHIVVPTVTIPAASVTLPWVDLGVLWGDVLQAGDAIWAQAGTASALVIQADGAIVVQ